MDSTFDNAICTYPIALGHKSKDNMITERSCINDINNREDPMFPFKVYSEKEKACIWVVLMFQFINMD